MLDCFSESCWVSLTLFASFERA